MQRPTTTVRKINSLKYRKPMHVFTPSPGLCVPPLCGAMGDAPYPPEGRRGSFTMTNRGMLSGVTINQDERRDMIDAAPVAPGKEYLR